MEKYADEVICIDQTVKNSIPAWIGSHVVHNGINLGSEPLIETDKVSQYKLTVGMAGVFLRSKGVYEFAEAAKILLVDKKYDLEFVIVGGNSRETKGIIGWMYKKLGFSEDVFSDIKSYKGLESPYVILVIDQINSLWEIMLYVGISRARIKCDIIFTDNVSPDILKTIITHLV